MNRNSQQEQLAAHQNSSALFSISRPQSDPQPALDLPVLSIIASFGQSMLASECIEVACEDCSGTGADPGGLSAFERTDCETCSGSGREQREYLAEAFRIVTSAETRMPVQREHLSAVIRHCRDLVNAAMSLPEVA